MHLRHLITGLTLALTVSLPLQAQMPADSPSASGGPRAPQMADLPVWSVGGGVLFSTSAIRGSDTEVFPVPVITYQGERFFIEGTTAGVRLYREEGIELAAILTPEFTSWDADDDPFLAGMQDRDISADAGLRLRVPLGDYVLFATARQDLLDESGGQLVSLKGVRTFQHKGWRFTPGLEVEWLSGERAEWYYGVQNNEARAGRPAYDPGGSFAYSADLSVSYRFGETRWSAFGNVAGTLLGGDLRDSPITDEDWESTVILGASYRF